MYNESYRYLFAMAIASGFIAFPSGPSDKKMVPNLVQPAGLENKKSAVKVLQEDCYVADQLWTRVLRGISSGTVSANSSGNQEPSSKPRSHRTRT